MVRFGRFETVRELHRTGLVTLYSGREAGVSEEKFAIKVFKPSSSVLDKDKVEAESLRHLSSARIQQKASSGGAQHWAPVYECGPSSEGDFYATDRYDRSLQQLIDGRIRLSGPVLYMIVNSIAKGLTELKEVCGRPHGNLKATNVLIAGTGEISQTKIVLSDPSPEDQTNSHVSWNRDLRAIAEFIYELITHRPTPAVDGWKAPDSPEWAKLGPKANDWRNFCNLLLGASVKSETVTIETAAEEIEKLREVKSLFSTRRLIAAGAVLIACIAVLLALVFRPPPPPEKAEWESLCSTYQAWVDDLRQRSNEQDTRALWVQDEELAVILQKIEMASYPDKVMRDEAKLYVREIVEHPEYAEQSKTQDALGAIEQIGGFFDPNSPNAWHFLARMNVAASRFRDLGWQASAADLSGLVEKAMPEPNKPIVENVNTILAISRKGVLENIDLSLQSVAEYEETIRSSDDPILAKLDYAYVTAQVADARDVNNLSDRLGKFVDLSRTIADFIERDLQSANIDQDTFLAEHGKDTPPETLTPATFTERLEVFEMYRLISPDPRDSLFTLVKRIKEAIPLALISNPVEANPCKQDFDNLQPDVETLRGIKAIEKNRSDITEALDRYIPILQELDGRVTAATETANEYLKRIQQVTSIATIDEINKKWAILRDDLFDKYPENELQQDLSRYAKLRQKMDVTEKDLLILDEELQRELSSQIEIQQDGIGWHSKVVGAYGRKRKDTISRILEKLPILDEVPDVNAQDFTRSKQAEFTTFQKSRQDLSGVVMALDTIEGALNDCYLLDDQLPQRVQEAENVRTLWDKWKNSDILTNPPLDVAFEEPIARIAQIEKIAASNDRQGLIGTALASESQREIIYTAWVRLGSLSSPPWPDKYEDLGKDREVRQKLRAEFGAIGRKNELLDKLTRTAIRREIMLIDKSASDDEILAGFDEFATESISNYSLNELEKLEGLSRTLADYICGADWQNDKIRKDIFFESSIVHNSEGSFTTQTYRDWLKEVVDYKKLEQDDRTNSQYSWDEKISKIDRELNSEVERAPEGDYQTKLRNLKNYFDSVRQQIDSVRELPLIEKHKEEIAKSNDYWKELRNIERRLKPEYCKRLDIDNGQLVFATTHLHPDFEPVDTDRKNSVQLPDAWEQIRGAVKDKQREWLDFFYTIDGNDAANVGWPRYIRSTKDPTVILAFIPTAPGNNEPFYMATHEIANQQYQLFLEKHGAARGNPKLPGWSIFTDHTKNKLIQCTVMNTPPTAIQWDDSNSTFQVAEAKADLPVTWVTYYGAQAYSQWFGGQLPSASQHEYACSAGTGSTQPWAGDISEIGSFAHVRGPVWQKAASDWNRNKDSKVPPLPIEPIGAIADYEDQENRILDPNTIILTSDVQNSPWPVADTAKANAWGLHNMIGNVWEWCQNSDDDTQPVICGGSCVAPPKYILLESESDYKVNFSDRNNDVGFRVIVLAR